MTSEVSEEFPKFSRKENKGKGGKCTATNEAVFRVGFAVFATLTPQNQPHNKTTATAVHLLSATRV
jgi:hypothetical protein